MEVTHPPRIVLIQQKSCLHSSLYMHLHLIFPDLNCNVINGVCGGCVRVCVCVCRYRFSLICKISHQTTSGRKMTEKICSSSEILFSLKKKGNPAICDSMDGPWGHWVKWDKSRQRKINITFICGILKKLEKNRKCTDSYHRLGVGAWERCYICLQLLGK